MIGYCFACPVEDLLVQLIGCSLSSLPADCLPVSVVDFVEVLFVIFVMFAVDVVLVKLNLVCPSCGQVLIDFVLNDKPVYTLIKKTKFLNNEQHRS